jgi:hypothetical protein
MSEPLLLLRKGSVLTPRSRLAYRLERLRRGKTAEVDRMDEISIASLLVRLTTLPFVTVADCISWPLLRRTLGRGSWWVVALRFHGPDAEFVRVAEAPTRDDADRRRAALERERTR